jgi:hypothetical protein
MPERNFQRRMWKSQIWQKENNNIKRNKIKGVTMKKTVVGMAPSSVIEPMVMLYRNTGDHKYIDFCEYIVDAWEHGPKIVSSLLAHGNVYKTANNKAYDAKGRRKPWQVKLLKTTYFCPLPFAVCLYEISRQIYAFTLYEEFSFKH